MRQRIRNGLLLGTKTPNAAWNVCKNVALVSFWSHVNTSENFHFGSGLNSCRSHAISPYETGLGQVRVEVVSIATVHSVNFDRIFLSRDLLFSITWRSWSCVLVSNGRLIGKSSPIETIVRVHCHQVMGESRRCNKRSEKKLAYRVDKQSSPRVVAYPEWDTLFPWSANQRGCIYNARFFSHDEPTIVAALQGGSPMINQLQWLLGRGHSFPMISPSPLGCGY